MSSLTRQNVKTIACATAVFVAAGLLYFLTAARDIVVGDTPELITAAVTLGVAHPPGYPLFTMLGHLFSLLPFGSIPFRVNLLAVTWDVLTVVVVFLTALRLTRSHLVAALAALILTVNPTFWSWSLVAEVFPLNNLLASILIYLLVAWHEQPQRIGPLVAAFFLAGLALTNHQTIVLMAPAFCFVLWQRRAALRRQLRVLPICVIAFFIGQLPYAYVPWASAHHPPYNWGNVSSFSDLVDLVTRRIYGSAHLVSVTGYTGGSPIPRIVALLRFFPAARCSVDCTGNGAGLSASTLVFVV
jgi:4-amino-4-deoxy-L-arabinose transferase-like glycosyltransferase